MKKFAKPASEIRPIAPGRGACIATDRITVDGRPVGYFYRDAPRDQYDSGWCFFAGDEDDTYLRDPANFEIYNLNTIANYDPDIVPFLDAPIGSAFVRDESSGLFVPDDPVATDQT